MALNRGQKYYLCRERLDDLLGQGGHPTGLQTRGDKDVMGKYQDRRQKEIKDGGGAERSEHAP